MSESRLCDRIGWAESRVQADLHVESANEDYLKHPRRRLDARVDNPGFASITLYLVDRVEESAKYAAQVVDQARDYFFGQYDGLDQNAPDWRKVPWMWEFEFPMWCSAALGQWNEFAHICTYVKEDLRVDFEHSEDERALYLAIAACCAGDKQRCPELLNTAQACASAEYRFGAQALAAIEAQDAAAFNERLRQFMERFVKSASVRNKSNYTRTISTVGTFLHHYGIHKGLAAPQLPPALMDRIVIFDTGGKGK